MLQLKLLLALTLKPVIGLSFEVGIKHKVQIIQDIGDIFTLIPPYPSHLQSFRSHIQVPSQSRQSTLEQH